jgi:hypothetical protein
MADEAVYEKPDPRIPVRLRARVSTIDPETDPFTGKRFFRSTEETCANVSRGGAFVSMRDVIPPGRRLLVELEIPGGRPVQAVGRVAWTRSSVMRDDPQDHTDLPAGSSVANASEPGIGVEFVGCRRDEMIALERFVTRSIRRRAHKRESDGTWNTLDR